MDNADQAGGLCQASKDDHHPSLASSPGLGKNPTRGAHTESE